MDNFKDINLDQDDPYREDIDIGFNKKSSKSIDLDDFIITVNSRMKFNNLIKKIPEFFIIIVLILSCLFIVQYNNLIG